MEKNILEWGLKYIYKQIKIFWNPFGKQGILIKGFYLEGKNVQNGGRECSDEKEISVYISCAVISWSKPDQTGHLPQTLSLKSQNLTSLLLASFVSLVATIECVDCL